MLLSIKPMIVCEGNATQNFVKYFYLIESRCFFQLFPLTTGNFFSPI